MSNIKLTIAYDGSNYAGWQRQPLHQGISIQEKIEASLAALLGHKVVIHGAGRTDAGVHAFSQVANFSCDKPLPTEKLQTIMNRLLPGDIRIIAAEEVEESFHARFSPHYKRYRYLLEQGQRCSPFAHKYSWQLGYDLDLAAMERASLALLGKHDFRHYTLTKVSATNFEREISELKIYPLAEDIETPFFPWQALSKPVIIDISGNGFLYKMVRIIVSRLVAVGKGKLGEEKISQFLSGDYWQNIPPAPSLGLFLEKIDYQIKK